VGESVVTSRRPRSTWLLVLVLVAALGVAGTITVLVIHGRSGSSGPSFAGTIQPTESISVNFPQSGRLLTVLVQPGQQVGSGQVLARQDSSAAAAALGAGRAAVILDQAILAGMKAPGLPAAQQQELAQQVNTAQAAEQVAATQATSSGASGRGSAAQASGVLVQAETIFRLDRAHYVDLCPKGVTVPAGVTDLGTVPVGALTTTTVPTTTTTRAAGTAKVATTDGIPVFRVQQYATCSALRAGVARDQAVVDALRAAKTQVSSLVGQLEAASAHSVQIGQSWLQTAEKTGTVLVAPASPTAISTAQAQLARDRANVVVEVDLMQQLTLTAPMAGLVTKVSGSAGDIVGGSSGSSGATAVAGGSAGGGGAGLVLMESDQLQVAAQVPETALRMVPSGRSVRLTVPALGRHFTGTVERTLPTPLAGAGVSRYGVIIGIDGGPAGLLPGMTATVSA
jgi:multidrug efflux pump subunit AcrA (membrane-fusion protein)